MNLEILRANAEALAGGAVTTVALGGSAIVIALALGVCLGIVRASPVPALRIPVGLFVDVIRGTPALVQMYLLYYGGPTVGVILDSFPAAVIALGINGSAYVSECVRAAILAIPREQVEAARAVGMSYLSTLRRIVLPQALPISLPSITNELIDVIKWSSLAAIIVVGEVTQIVWSIVSKGFHGYIELFLFLTVFYLALTSSLAFASRRLEARRAHYK